MGIKINYKELKTQIEEKNRKNILEALYKGVLTCYHSQGCYYAHDNGQSPGEWSYLEEINTLLRCSWFLLITDGFNQEELQSFERDTKIEFNSEEEKKLFWAILTTIRDKETIISVKFPSLLGCFSMSEYELEKDKLEDIQKCILNVLKKV